MAIIGVDYSKGALWYRLKGTSENDNMSSNGFYPANAPSDHRLLFYGYGGNDTIQLAGGTRNSAIHGGNGNDSIKNWSGDAFINGGKGNDYIWNKGSNVVIGIGTNIAGSATDESGNDTIDNSGSNVSISSGTGNDSIKNNGSEVTINAGAGRDTIISSGSDVVINSGGASDYIEGFDEDDSLEGVTYNYLTVAGNDVLLVGDKATVTVANGTKLERFIVNDKDISSQILKNIYNDKSNIKITAPITTTPLIISVIK